VRVYDPWVNAYDEVAHHDPLALTVELARTTPLAVVTEIVAPAVPLHERYTLVTFVLVHERVTSERGARVGEA
jgi:hypothetical protein